MTVKRTPPPHICSSVSPTRRACRWETCGISRGTSQPSSPVSRHLLTPWTQDRLRHPPYPRFCGGTLLVALRIVVRTHRFPLRSTGRCPLWGRSPATGFSGATVAKRTSFTFKLLRLQILYFCSYLIINLSFWRKRNHYYSIGNFVEIPCKTKNVFFQLDFFLPLHLKVTHFLSLWFLNKLSKRAGIGLGLKITQSSLQWKRNRVNLF